MCMEQAAVPRMSPMGATIGWFMFNSWQLGQVHLDFKRKLEEGCRLQVEEERQAAEGGAGMKAGDMVTWTHIRRTGRKVKLTARRGRVVSVGGGIVRVRYAGTIYALTEKQVRPDGQQTELTEFALGLAGASLRAEGGRG